MKIAITGSEGKVAQALIAELNPTKFTITPIDLPEHDATDLSDLTETTLAHDAIIHLAWKKFECRYRRFRQ